MEEIKRKLRELTREILEYIKEVDKWIESSYSDIYYEIHGFPFIYDMYLTIKDKFINYTSINPNIIFNLYDTYPTSFIELPVVRGIRTTTNLDLSSEIINIRRLQTRRGNSNIYERYPGTLITFGRVEAVKSAEILKNFEKNYFLYVLLDFPYLYSKPLLYMEDIKVNRNLWHLNCILPNITSFLTISNEMNNEVEYLMPFSGVVFLDYSNKRISRRKIFGHNIECLEVIGHLLFINTKTLSVRYFGPFPVVIPKTSLTEDSLINVNSDILITYVQGFINFGNKGYLLNDVRNERGYIIILKELSFLPELYSLAHFGHIQIENVKLLNSNIQIPKIVVNVKTINKINRSIEEAIDVYIKKRKSHGKSILNNIDNCNYLTVNKLQNIICKDNINLWMYHPTILSYSLFGEMPIEEIKNMMKFDNFTEKLKNIQYINKNLKKSFELYKKIIGNERKLIKKHKLWRGI